MGTSVILSSFVSLLVISYAAGNGGYSYPVPSVPFTYPSQSVSFNQVASGAGGGWSSRGDGDSYGNTDRQSSSFDREDRQRETRLREERERLRVEESRITQQEASMKEEQREQQRIQERHMDEMKRLEQLRETRIREDRLREEREQKARVRQEQNIQEMKSRLTDTNRQSQTNRNQGTTGSAEGGGSRKSSYQFEEQSFTSGGSTTGGRTTSSNRDLTREELLNQRGSVTDEVRESYGGRNNLHDRIRPYGSQGRGGSSDFSSSIRESSSFSSGSGPSRGSSKGGGFTQFNDWSNTGGGSFGPSGSSFSSSSQGSGSSYSGSRPTTAYSDQDNRFADPSETTINRQSTKITGTYGSAGGDDSSKFIQTNDQRFGWSAQNQNSPNNGGLPDYDSRLGGLSFQSSSSQGSAGAKGSYGSASSTSNRATISRNGWNGRYSTLMGASTDEVASMTGGKLMASRTSAVCPEGQKYSSSQNCCVYSSESQSSLRAPSY